MSSQSICFRGEKKEKYQFLWLTKSNTLSCVIIPVLILFGFVCFIRCIIISDLIGVKRLDNMHYSWLENLSSA